MAPGSDQFPSKKRRKQKKRPCRTPPGGEYLHAQNREWLEMVAWRKVHERNRPDANETVAPVRCCMSWHVINYLVLFALFLDEASIESRRELTDGELILKRRWTSERYTASSRSRYTWSALLWNRDLAQGYGGEFCTALGKALIGKIRICNMQKILI